MVGEVSEWAGGRAWRARAAASGRAAPEKGGLQPGQPLLPPRPCPLPPPPPYLPLHKAVERHVDGARRVAALKVARQAHINERPPLGATASSGEARGAGARARGLQRGVARRGAAAGCLLNPAARGPAAPPCDRNGARQPPPFSAAPPPPRSSRSAAWRRSARCAPRATPAVLGWRSVS